mmetsp:Transcript_23770/g.93551  ORF Transcript_23770/g.93551 Transcript_23770/m.93551 type:complete len:92 (+) Transcript_23770:746-1021(+)
MVKYTEAEPYSSPLSTNASDGRFAKWSKGEQSGLGHGVSPDELREANLKYEVKFGFRFLTSATGRTGEAIYEELLRRSERTRELEVRLSEL